jgi:hypothetical protein
MMSCLFGMCYEVKGASFGIPLLLNLVRIRAFFLKFLVAVGLTSCATEPELTGPSLAITATNQRFNARAEANSGGERQNAESIYSFTTNADSFQLDVYGSFMFDSPAANVAVNGVFFQAVGNFPAGYTGKRTYHIKNLPGTGDRVVEIISAIQQDRGTGKPVGYVTPVRVTVPTGFSLAELPPHKNLAEAIWIFGDSRSMGAGHYLTDGYMNSWPRYQNRHLRPNCDIYLAGHSAMIGAEFIDTPAKRESLVSEFQAAVKGYQVKQFYYASMTNDYACARYTPQELKQYLVALEQLVLEKEPSSILHFETAALRTDAQGEGKVNALGYTLEEYRGTMAEAVAEVNNKQVHLIKGPEVTDKKYLADDVHDSAAGDIYHAERVQELL